jgi:glyoxylase-like metal-dependent hydrolase (beta-lactamase superfamily II)
MRHILLLAVLFSAACSSAKNAIPDYDAQQISASTYVIHGPTGMPNPENQGFINNPAFIVTEQGVIVVDPGGSLQSGEMVIRQIRKVTDKPVTHVFNTHVHGDHWLGNQAFTEAFPEVVIYAHPKMIEQVKGPEGQRWVNMVEELTAGASAGTQVVAPNHEVGHDESLTIDGKTFHIYAPGHAHSGTDIMIHFVDESVVFLGDNVSNQRIIRLDDANYAGGIGAIELAIGLNAQHYIPGHGPSGDVNVPKAYLNYLQTLYHTVAHLYDEGMSDFEMKDQVAAKLTQYHGWQGFDDQLGRHISLAVLEVEQNLFQ